MKLPIEWLKETIDVPWDDDELGERLVRLGIGIETAFDGLFDLEITPNRGDLLSVLGIAREIKALTGNDIKLPPIPTMPKHEPPLKVTVDPSLAPRYTTAVLHGVTIASTKNEKVIGRLKACGMRPVNNVVDLTNYVMLLTGQPTHAFDYDKIKAKTMRVRVARAGERLTTLDGLERALSKGTPVIEDGERIIDLPGIMGGQNSEIGRETKNIVIQAAVFDPILIRRSSRALGLTTEASYRFERGVDAGNTLPALSLLAHLVAREAGGTSAGLLDFSRSAARRLIELTNGYFGRVLGTEYPRDEAAAILKRLGCTVSKHPDSLVVEAPSWRHDLAIPEDLIEEVARVKGYETLKSTPLPKHAAPPSDEWRRRESFKETLVRSGGSEVMTYSLLGEKDVRAGGIALRQAVRISNPLSQELAFVRPSLLPGLLKALAKNPSVDPIFLFEIGHVAVNKKEWVSVGVVAGGRRVEGLFETVSALGLKLQKVSPKLLSAYKIRKSNVWAATAEWESVKRHVHFTSRLTMPRPLMVKPLSKFPPVSRDVSLIVDDSVQSDEIKMAIAQASEYIQLVELFDEFASPKLGVGKKSLAFHITYQHPQRTLTSKEVGRLQSSVESRLKKQFTAMIR